MPVSETVNPTNPLVNLFLSDVVGFYFDVQGHFWHGLCMSVELASIELSDQEAAFVRALSIEGRAPDDAALAAGFSDGAVGWQLLRRRRVAAAVHAEVQRLLTIDAPVSLKVLRKLRDDEATPARTRADIGLKLLQMAGHGQDSAGSKPDKPLNEMSSSELLEYLKRNQDEINRLETELASRARDVTPQTAAQPAPKPLTFLD